MLDSALAHYGDIKIIAGGARGADSLAVEWAKSRGIPFQEFPANWSLHGRKAAGPKRNQQMLDENNIFLVIAFPGGSGTADMVARAQKAGIHVKRF